MMKSCDVAVVGGGVVGASVAFHLKKLGRGKVLLLDRGPLCGGGTAKSCAIVRTHYSIPSNTRLAVRSLEVFRDFADYLGDASASSGFVNSGYLIVAPEGAVAEALAANLEMQAEVGAATQLISREEAAERHPLLALDDIAAAGYEPESGYAEPYLTTTGFANAARRLGAEVRSDLPVTGLVMEGARVRGIRTSAGDVAAGTVVCAMGPWSLNLGQWLGITLPLEVSRHTVLTFRSATPYEATLPVVKDMTTDNKMYFRPASGGVVLVGTGDFGDPVAEADAMDENVALDFIALQGGQIARRVPCFAEAGLAASWVGPYDITPDWNPVLGPVPGIEGLLAAFGFSGHGFKLSPAVGEALALLALGQEPGVDLHPYRFTRFDEGALLTGRYGIGSLS